MEAKPRNIDEFLATIRDDKRAALEKLRATIRSMVPRAEEVIRYGVPALYLNGKLLVAFGAAKNHCSFFPGALPVKVHKDELKSYSTSTGTIRFQPDRPLPIGLVRRLVKTRIAERADQERGMLLKKSKPSAGLRLKRPVYPMPDFIRNALKAKKLAVAYEHRPPYQRNDYVGWITRAKLLTTQQKRLAQMLDELARGDVYMNMAYRRKVNRV